MKIPAFAAYLNKYIATGRFILWAAIDHAWPPPQITHSSHVNRRANTIAENRSATDNTAPRRLQVYTGSLLTSDKLPKAPISHLAEI